MAAGEAIIDIKNRRNRASIFESNASVHPAQQLQQQQQQQQHRPQLQHQRASICQTMDPPLPPPLPPLSDASTVPTAVTLAASAAYKRAAMRKYSLVSSGFQESLVSATPVHDSFSLSEDSDLEADLHDEEGEKEAEEEEKIVKTATEHSGLEQPKIGM